MRVMPNTAGCRTPKEAITTAQMARELFATDWVKLEVIGNDDTLQPDLFGLVEAAAALDQGRLQGASLHHRGPGRRRAPAGGGLRGADALGRADRHGARARQPLCAEVAPAVLSRACRSSSMPASARPRRRRRPWRWASTRCCSTRRSPRPPTRCAWRAPSPPPSRRAAPPTRPGLMEVRDMAAPSTPVAGTPFFDLDRP